MDVFDINWSYNNHHKTDTTSIRAHVEKKGYMLLVR